MRKVFPQPVKMQISRCVDKGFTRYLLHEFDETCHSVSTLLGVDVREMVFQLDPIWLPGMRKSVSTTGENADFKTCRQRFYQVIVA